MAFFKRAFPDQALALPVGPLGVLFGNGRDARHGAVAPFPAQPPQEPPLQQLGVEPVGLGPAMFPRYGDTRGMDHMRLHPSRQRCSRPSSLSALGSSFLRGWRSMPGSIPATSQLDWLISTTAMIVLSWSRATRDLLRSFGWGIRALHQLVAATMVPSPRRLPHTISPVERGGFELSVPRD